MSRPCAVCGGDHGTDEPVLRDLIDCLTEALRQRHNPANCDDPRVPGLRGDPAGRGGDPVKLSELRVCDGCGGPLFVPPARWFQVVRSSGAIVRPEAMAVAEIAARCGVSIAQAEAQMTSPPDDVVDVLGDLEPRAGAELFVCVRCYHNRTIADVVLHRQADLAAAARARKAS